VTTLNAICTSVLIRAVQDVNLIEQATLRLSWARYWKIRFVETEIFVLESCVHANILRIRRHKSGFMLIIMIIIINYKPTEHVEFFTSLRFKLTCWVEDNRPIDLNVTGLCWTFARTTNNPAFKGDTKPEAQMKLYRAVSQSCAEVKHGRWKETAR
jgi:hypothetical protein